jgi:hypothetical protein
MDELATELLALVPFWTHQERAELCALIMNSPSDPSLKEAPASYQSTSTNTWKQCYESRT